MLRIRLDTTYLDLAGASLQLTLHNPLFDDGGEQATYSFPFKLPATPRNAEKLKHPHRIDTSDNAVFENAVLEIGGAMHIIGRLELKRQPFTKDTIQAVFKNETENVFDELAKIDINEILETVTSSLNPPTAEWLFAPTAPPQHYSMVIDGVTMIVTVTESASMTVSEVIDALVFDINAAFPGMASNSGGTHLALDANEVEDHPVESYNSALTLTSVTSPAQSEQQAFLNHVDSVNTTSVTTHCFPVMRWIGFYKGNNLLKFTNWINPWFDGSTITVN